MGFGKLYYTVIIELVKTYLLSLLTMNFKTEDAQLVIGLNRYGKDWATIKKKLFSNSTRTNVNLKDRHRQLVKDNDPRV